MTVGNLALFLLLLAGVAAGWWLGRSSGRSRPVAGPDIPGIYQDYFVGLNYLLRDEPDEAIDTFIRALEINGDTVDTHLALGTLLRRRGKVDKAIKVHQTLLAREGLDAAFADSVQLELSNDYIAAGLLDRAERLLNELLDAHGTVRPEALRHLITIYQTEKEWGQAIASVEKLLAQPGHKKDSRLQGMAAHFCCELADRALESGDISGAREQIQRALQFDRANVRAVFLAARVEQHSGKHARAIQELQRIRQHQPRFLSELIEPMSISYRALGAEDELEDFLRQCLATEPRVSVISELCDLLLRKQGEAAVISFLSDAMKRHPTLRGMSRLMAMQANECSGQLQDDLKLFTAMTDKWLANKPSYRCDECGLETRNLYWQCPSCQKWDSIFPILGVEGE